MKRIKKKTVSRRRRRLDPNNFGELTKELSDRLRTRAPVTYERGRDRMRDQVAVALECTPTRARHIVTSLVDRGFVRFGPHPNYEHDLTVGCWTYHPNHA
jgi:hypothetical protein